ncbi:hypothetical protein PIB30_082142 [Stylosanthes scabra]|uniref:Uncharacterized protein n=1 Tax=Stylosanthes scabra TaxID=79078 RepID=A0ABU6YSH7_9FABA|nr:hypothetical protein [Stylosanthes scabra]
MRTVIEGELYHCCRHFVLGEGEQWGMRDSPEREKESGGDVGRRQSWVLKPALLSSPLSPKELTLSCCHWLYSATFVFGSPKFARSAAMFLSCCDHHHYKAYIMGK